MLEEARMITRNLLSQLYRSACKSDDRWTLM